MRMNQPMTATEVKERLEAHRASLPKWEEFLNHAAELVRKRVDEIMKEKNK